MQKKSRTIDECLLYQDRSGKEISLHRSGLTDFEGLDDFTDGGGVMLSQRETLIYTGTQKQAHVPFGKKLLGEKAKCIKLIPKKLTWTISQNMFCT